MSRTGHGRRGGKVTDGSKAHFGAKRKTRRRYRQEARVEASPDSPFGASPVRRSDGTLDRDCLNCYVSLRLSSGAVVVGGIYYVDVLSQRRR
jgi:hypothetical protein